MYTIILKTGGGRRRLALTMVSSLTKRCNVWMKNNAAI